MIDDIKVINTWSINTAVRWLLAILSVILFTELIIAGDESFENRALRYRFPDFLPFFLKGIVLLRLAIVTEITILLRHKPVWDTYSIIGDRGILVKKQVVRSYNIRPHLKQ